MRVKRSATNAQDSSQKRLRLDGPEVGEQIQIQCGHLLQPTGDQTVARMPFWADSPNQHPAAKENAPLPANSASVEGAVSLSHWQPAFSSLPDKARMSGDEETEDTASSSCASDSTADGFSAALSAVLDDGDSAEPQVTPFSFGHRPCITPDVSHFETWDMVDSLLALAQC